MADRHERSQTPDAPHDAPPPGTDPTQRPTPAGKVEEIIELAEDTGASTDPEESDVGEAQLEEHGPPSSADRR